MPTIKRSKSWKWMSFIPQWFASPIRNYSNFYAYVPTTISVVCDNASFAITIIAIISARHSGLFPCSYCSVYSFFYENFHLIWNLDIFPNAKWIHPAINYRNKWNCLCIALMHAKIHICSGWICIARGLLREVDKDLAANSKMVTNLGLNFWWRLFNAGN